MNTPPFLCGAAGVIGIGDGTLESVCPVQCGICGPGGTFAADGYGRRLAADQPALAALVAAPLIEVHARPAAAAAAKGPSRAAGAGWAAGHARRLAADDDGELTVGGAVAAHGGQVHAPPGRPALACQPLKTPLSIHLSTPRFKRGVLMEWPECPPGSPHQRASLCVLCELLV